MRVRHLALAAVVTVSARGVAAQQPSTFVMLMGSDTLAIERVTRSANHLDGEFAAPSRGARVRYAATLNADGTVPRIDTWAYHGSDTTGAHATMQLQGDSMRVEAQGRTMAFGTKAAALPYFNPSMGLLEQAVLRARTLGGTTVEVPLFAAEGGATVPLGVTFVGSDSAHLSLGGVAMNIALGVDGRVTGMSVPSQNVRVVRVEGARAAPKPDYSAPADAPYTAEEVTIRTPKGLQLTGTLTLPRARAARGAPAVVTITGSGTEERDESIPGVKGYRPFRQIADTLGRRGIAVLRLDDRGAGGSDMGPSGAQGPTSADFADDIRAGLAYLRTRADIDGDRLGLVGHSEGGLIAPMVAATDAKLRAIVLMAGPSQTGRTILKYQNEYAVDSMLKLTGARRDSALRDAAGKLDSAAKTMPWIQFFLDYDPVATAKRVKQPVLILQGATDRQVTPDQAPALAAAFRAGGNRDVTMRIFPSTDHLFLADLAGNPSGYASLPSKNVRPEVLGAIADWLATKLVSEGK